MNELPPELIDYLNKAIYRAEVDLYDNWNSYTQGYKDALADILHNAWKAQAQPTPPARVKRSLDSCETCGKVLHAVDGGVCPVCANKRNESIAPF
jgi:hypothetical protein